MQPGFSVSKDQALRLSVIAVFALFVVMLPRYTDIAKTWYVLLIIGALGYLVFNPAQLRQTSLVEKIFLGTVISHFLWLAFSYYANGEPGRGSSFLWGRHFYFLFVIPLFFLFRKIDIPHRVIVIILFSSVALSTIDNVIDLARGIDHRLQGMNPNAFGPIQLCLSGMLLFYFIRLSDNRLRRLALAGTFLGVTSVILSLSKSTWMTFTLLVVFFVFYLGRSVPAWKKLGAVAVTLVLISSSYLLPLVKTRIDDALANVTAYLATDDYRDDSRIGSFGTRAELWKTGWYIFLEHPVLGVGVGGFQVEAGENSERYQVNEVVQHFKYVHNQYLAALATRGIPGLILFLLVISIPLYIAMTQKAIEGESEASRLAVMLISLTYLIGCLAEDHFEGKSAIMFVSVMLALLLAKISAASREHRP